MAAGNVVMEKIFPQFEPAMGTSGRWFVAVQTGKGPNSHIGDFETELEARTLDCDQSEILAQQTGRTNVTPRRRGGAADLLASFGPVSRGWDSVGGSS